MSMSVNHMLQLASLCRLIVRVLFTAQIFRSTGFNLLQLDFNSVSVINYMIYMYINSGQTLYGINEKSVQPWTVKCVVISQVTLTVYNSDSLDCLACIYIITHAIYS